MPGPAITCKSDILHELSREEFWLHAFDKEAPFYESYIKYFKKGIIEKIPGLLDIHREAIYYLQDAALGIMVTRLIDLVVEYPDSSFLESLSFFLSRDDQKDRLINAFSDFESKLLKELMNEIDSLSISLINVGDSDIAKEFRKFRSLITSIISESPS